jgi:hypothetical protein
MAFSITSFTQASNPSSKYCLGTQTFVHFKSLVSHILESIVSFQATLVFSRGSRPFVISYNKAASLTVFVRVHGQSKLDAIAFTQYLEFLP